MAIGSARKIFDEGKYCALMTFDIKKLLNPLRSNRIIKAFIGGQTQNYTYSINNLRLLPTAEASPRFRRIIITTSFPQESALGTLLWRLMYEGLLWLPFYPPRLGTDLCK